MSGPDDPVPCAIEQEVARLRDLDGPGLRRRWRVLLGGQAPEHLPAWLLARVLAYRVQAKAFGDLDRAIARQLDGLAGGNGPEAIPLPPGRLVKPGTLLVREWAGSLHHVMALEDGFAWSGTTYPSLSAVARAITGTSWNGPRFFGMRGPGSQDGRTAS